MPLHRLLNNFTAGELTPLLDARVDLQKYDTGCRTLENMRALPFGGATFRAGTLYVATTKDSTKQSRVIPFNFSTAVTYVIEMGNLYMRFYQDGSAVTVASAATWLTATPYTVGNYVTHSAVIYFCLIAHTSGTFATDLAAGKWVAQTIYELPTPFLEAELFAVQFKEINDVLYLVHPNHQPQKLSRLAATNWTITEVPWKYPALLDENSDITKQIQVVDAVATALVAGVVYRITSVGSTDWTVVGAASNNVDIVFTASGPGTGDGVAIQNSGTGAALKAYFNVFDALHVGAFWELRHVRDSTRLLLDLSVTSGSDESPVIRVKGAWTITTTQRWYGIVNVRRSVDNGVTWTTIRQFARKSDGNVSESGQQDTEALFKIEFFCSGDPYSSAAWAGTPPTQYVKAQAIFEVANVYVAGLVRITAVSDAQNATCTIVNPVERGDATWTWSEGAFSSYRGFPQAVGLYEQRLLYAGTTYRPNTIWGSVAADFDNFTFGDLDDAALMYQIADTEQNPVEWLAALTRVYAGSSGGEYILASGNENEALTPSNVTIRRKSSYGSAAQPALPIDNGVLFLQRQGRRLREFREASIYANPGDFICPDLTLLAEHITLGGIVQMDFARLPDPQVYCVRADGVLCVMTYNREQNITAWSRYVTQGYFESVAAVYGSPSDVVYCVVKRTVDGVTKRFIEVFTAEQADKTNACYLDCAVAKTQSSSVTVTGLSHIEGKTVSAVADGNVTENLVVASGSVTLPKAATVVRVGLAYTGTLKPMKMDAMLANGTSQGRRKRFSEFCIRFSATLGCWYGNSATNNPSTGQYAAEIPFRNTDDPMDSSPPLFTGDKIVPNNTGSTLEGDIVITQKQPLPFTVLGIFGKAEVFGE